MLKIHNHNWTKSLCAMLAALLVSLLVLNYARSEQLRDAENRISAVYEKAFYETCELTEEISNKYRKLLVAADDAQMLTLLSEISREAQSVSSNLALLPLGQETVSATIKFINQAADYSAVLGQKIATGGTVSEEDYDAMLQLSDRAAQFSKEMESLLVRYEGGEAVFSAEDYSANGSESLYPLNNSSSDYPVLLYDGPFSDSMTGGNYEMLAGLAEITAQQAEEKLRSLIQVDEISYVGESTPEVAVYEFQIRSGDYIISAGITKQGGEALYLLPETQETQINYTEDQLYEIAEAFLREHGYGEMEMSYSSRYDGILTINYAAIQEDVILYPDLIKLQLSMKDGRVIGMDAKAYLKNHMTRRIAEPAISREDALAAIGPKLAAQSIRLSIIPQNGAEYLCYEIVATDGEADFLAYIDAQSGVERELMQLVSRSNGTLVM